MLVLDKVTIPVPNLVNPKLFVPSLTRPEIVKLPEPPTELLLPNIIEPLCVAGVADELIRAPAELTPRPFIVNGLYKVKPLRSSEAPLLIVLVEILVFVPRAPFVIDEVDPVELTPPLT